MSSISELRVHLLLEDAITNMKRYWKDREHFGYSVTYVLGLESITCGVAILKTVDKSNPWTVMVEIPFHQDERINETFEDIDQVWGHMDNLEREYRNRGE